ncbi:MAG TPA: hypothetical protein ENF48_13220 [Desulfobacteraceae bacterium]|nr:hypothetical protein [Deltaproteobacteria bacterium]HDI61289.1 hypothetical protein [Desulfobacteraceae bacterium]
MKIETERILKIPPPTLDGENPYRDELTQLRIDRLGQRLTLLSVLLPIALVVILALGYLDLKQRVAGLQDSGAATVQTLSDDLMARFATLSVRVAELEAHLEKTMANAAALRAEQADRVAKLEARIKDLEAEKIGGQQLKAATGALAQQVASLTERLDGQDAALKTLSARLDEQMQAAVQAINAVKADLTPLAETLALVRKDQAALADEVKRLDAALQTDRQAAQQALEQQKAASDRQTRQALQPLEARLEALRRKIDQIQNEVASLKVSAGPPIPAAPRPSSSPAPSPTPASTVPSPSPAALPGLEPGQIIEKPLE